MFTNSHRKMLQSLMQSSEWEAIEAYLQHYTQQNFVQQSIKRDSEFETVWQAASQEGGRSHLLTFFQNMEEEAKQI